MQSSMEALDAISLALSRSVPWCLFVTNIELFRCIDSNITPSVHFTGILQHG